MDAQFFVNQRWVSYPNWPVWLNDRVFIYKLNGNGLESRCCHLKQYFYGGDSTTDKIQHQKRYDLNTKLSNRYFNPNHEISLNLQRYATINKKEFIELLKKPNYQQLNLTSEERLKLKYLSENRNLTIKWAD